MNMGQDRQMQMVGGNGGNQFRQYAWLNAGNPARYNDVTAYQNQIGNCNLVAARAEGNAAWQNGLQIRCYNCRGVGHYARNCIVRPIRRDAAYLQTQLLIAQKEEAGIQLQAEEYYLMAAAADLDEIKEVNTNCILMANLQQASTSGTQTDNAPVYDTDGSPKVLLLNTLKALLLTEYPTRNPASTFPSNLSKESRVLRIVIGQPKGLMKPILVLTASAQNGMGRSESASIVLAASIRVLLFLSAMPFC
nr:hypothetical protein [Tanacetum cinerariifolium]